MLGIRRFSAAQRVRAAAVLAVLTTAVVLATLGLGIRTYLQLRTQVQNNRQLVHDVTQQNVDARYGGCRSGDDLREALYQQALQSRRTTPLLLSLVPSLDTDQVRDLIARATRRQLKAYQPRGTAGCTTYALAAVPKESRHQYRVNP